MIVRSSCTESAMFQSSGVQNFGVQMIFLDEILEDVSGRKVHQWNYPDIWLALFHGYVELPRYMTSTLPRLNGITQIYD